MNHFEAAHTTRAKNMTMPVWRIGNGRCLLNVSYSWTESASDSILKSDLANQLSDSYLPTVTETPPC